MSSRISFEPTTEDCRNGTLHRDHSVNSVLDERIAYENWLKEHPSLLQNFHHLEAAANGKLVAVFLDYDGTLTPIVNDPDAAFMTEHARDAVRRVATLFPTAIISGRGREKVEQFVQLRELYYAGSHGMDIRGPDTLDCNNGNSNDLSDSAENNNNNGAFQPAAHFEPLMKQIETELWESVSSIPGSSVENNKFCVSVHFRNCPADRYEDVIAAVEQVLARQDSLHITRGRKVLEIRPNVEWNKGTALEYLLKMLGLDKKDVFCLYIGDDRTDEDAFRVLRERGLGAGILVSNRNKPTAGRWTLRDPSEVAAFLNRLVAWGSSNRNGWHREGGCRGWQCTGGLVNGGSYAGDTTMNDDFDGVARSAAAMEAFGLAMKTNDRPTTASSLGLPPLPPKMSSPTAQ